MFDKEKFIDDIENTLGFGHNEISTYEETLRIVAFDDEELNMLSAKEEIIRMIMKTIKSNKIKRSDIIDISINITNIWNYKNGIEIYWKILVKNKK